MEEEMSGIARRSWLKALPVVGAGLVVDPIPAVAAEKEDEEEEVTPAEDLMREHGALKRILLVYDEVRERIAAGKDFPPQAVVDSAKIIQTFIEGYHEKLEEEHLFPRFRKKGKLVALVDTLELQHKAGREVTERILFLASSGVGGDAAKKDLASALHQFVRMYAPHEAREDTVLFPALHEVVSHREYDALGEDFEKKEHELFGKAGFEGIVERVGEIEKRLGIFDLAQFTPR
jgi:hemerythrin-like domain-containing protein